VVSIALNSNRDVQKALADIEAARAQYGETRASLFPTVDAELSHTRSKTVASGLSSASQADGAVSSFDWTCSARTRACRARRAKPGLPANSPRRIPG
jgi:multidrug efflux system outer membrane protein